MEETEVGEEAEVLRQGAGDVGVVEVDSGDCDDVGVIGCGCTVDSGVVADMGSIPV